MNNHAAYQIGEPDGHVTDGLTCGLAAVTVEGLTLASVQVQQQLTGQGRHVRLAVQAPEGGLVCKAVCHQVHHRELAV